MGHRYRSSSQQRVKGVAGVITPLVVETDTGSAFSITDLKDANFTGKVTLTDLDPPAGYTISGEGQGGVAGFAKGSAKVALEEEGGETVLRYGVQAQVGGKLAQIGSRLIDATARKMADDFFSKFVALVTPGGVTQSSASG